MVRQDVPSLQQNAQLQEIKKIELQGITKPRVSQEDAAAIGAPRSTLTKIVPETPGKPGQAVFPGQTRTDAQSESSQGAPGPAGPQRSPEHQDIQERMKTQELQDNVKDQTSDFRV
ncbi:hypothetical protein B9Z55_009836 [Caenorhabditis nigoni]|uniref:Uncharacterized protein n=1 Tax=Caenorhabditis nigoni TaxID=1611254 RepID=A0A2G5UTS3_9PELO|nr:hypothetical protein B9Z55_009836 [Caenorhabditis nigoni]